MGVLTSWMDAGIASCAIRIFRYSWEAIESGMDADTMAGRLKEPKIVRPSRMRKAEYVASGILVRPMERADLGGDFWEFSSLDLVSGDGVVVAAVLCLWPNSCANFTSFQIPTEELTKNVEAKEAMPTSALSTLGYSFPRMVSDALAVAKVAA